jgi:hypothetical protein
LRQVCHALDECRTVLHGMGFFPFAPELFTLFFERIHASQPVVPHFHARPILDVHMHKWGQLIPKKGQLKFPISSVSKDVCDLLASEDNLVLDTVQYPYMGLDWRRCPNILFTTVESPDERGNIIVMF